jgi:hypothetical protein
MRSVRPLTIRISCGSGDSPNAVSKESSGRFLFSRQSYSMRVRGGLGKGVANLAQKAIVVAEQDLAGESACPITRRGVPSKSPHRFGEPAAMTSPQPPSLSKASRVVEDLARRSFTRQVLGRGRVAAAPGL